MKKATVKLILDPRRVKSDGTYPIVLRITHRTKTRYIFTEYSVTKEDWDKKGQQVIPTSSCFKNVTRVNNLLQNKLLTAGDIITKLNASGNIDSMTVSDVRNQIETNTDTCSIQSFTEKIIADFEAAGKLGNASVYKQAIAFLNRFTNRKEILFDEITFELLKSIELKFLSETRFKKVKKGKSSNLNSNPPKNTLNGLSPYLRTIRAIYNRAINEGKANLQNYPFKAYSIKETKTRKRAIRKPDMDKIKDAQFDPGSILWHTRNIFLFSFYNRGMNFADIAKLRISDIEQDRIHYNRSKTGKPLSIKLSDSTREILSSYIVDKSGNDFVFPILKRDTPELQMMDLYNERRMFNKYLSRIGKTLEIEGKLTSYVARHSWATIAKDMNVPIAVISEGLGHEDIKTTQIYLDSFDDDVLDQANQLITG